jgi:hypothetical protein
MPAKSDGPDRDPKQDAAARVWAQETRRRGEAGELTDDSEYVARRLAKEKRKLERS